MDAIVEMVGAVKALGLETCMTLGMLDRDQSDRLSAAGLDYYNHNIDTSERYYPQVTRRAHLPIVSTRWRMSGSPA
jgi:biotin synthase